MTATRTVLPDGRRHFQHGPIDLIIGADAVAADVGAAGAGAALVEAAHDAAWARFTTVLTELVAELPALRKDVASSATNPLRGVVARRMWQACRRLHDGRFLSSMAAVAGAVAEELIACYRRPGIARAWVNNGGDIALHLATGQSVRIGLFSDLARLDQLQLQDGLRLDGRFTLAASHGVGGVATSGWRGRSQSLGIADSVTVLAATASLADAAATVIANAVNVADPRIVRGPACDVKDDSDLGDRLVTIDVPTLAAEQVDAALAAGLAVAQRFQDDGLIIAASLICQQRLVGTSFPGYPGYPDGVDAGHTARVCADALPV